ncbi:glycosyltransferase family 2 protein [Paenalcaligenes hominis]|uniref:glycosyltransferase family 2 protein n=1 Tax=Paenalcaligenes hominis TaxID=643674 RepID=UPI0035235C56
MPKDYPAIDVVLAAFNGERYIKAQIESILEQDYAGPIRILVRDDGSTDATVAIVQQLMTQPLPARRHIDLFERTEGKGNVTENFAQLLALSTAPYVALADQDDIWLAHKLRIQLVAMQSLERQFSPAPFLVCSDLRVVDAELNLIADSFWALQKLNPTWINDWRDLLVQNMVTGCTILINRAAVTAVLPIPVHLKLFHDHWIAIAVSQSGHAVALAEPTVLYRQHGRNVEAAHSFNYAYARRKLTQLVAISRRSQAAAHYLHQPVSFFAVVWRKLKLNLQRFFYK